MEIFKIKIENKEYFLDLEKKALLDLSGNKIKGALNLYRNYIAQEGIEGPRNVNNHSYIGLIKKYLLGKKSASISFSNRSGDTNEDSSSVDSKQIKPKNDLQFQDLFGTFKLKEIKDVNKKKLLIIGCSDSKNNLNPVRDENLINDLFGKELKVIREQRMKEYKSLLIDRENDSYFDKKRNNRVVNTIYFSDSIDGNLYPALQLYGSDRSIFH